MDGPHGLEAFGLAASGTITCIAALGAPVSGLSGMGRVMIRVDILVDVACSVDVTGLIFPTPSGVDDVIEFLVVTVLEAKFTKLGDTAALARELFLFLFLAVVLFGILFLALWQFKEGALDSVLGED